MKRIYLDSCIFIYHLTTEPRLGEKSSSYFIEAERGRHEIVASALVLHEVMTGVYRFSKDLSGEIYSLLRLHPGIDWVDYNLEIADMSARLRGETSLKTPDTIHIATALATSCSDFVTNDTKIKKYEEEFGLRVTLL